MTVAIVNNFRSNLKTQLEARAGLSGIKIFSYSPGEVLDREFISLGGANTSISPFTMGGQYEQTNSINGLIFVNQVGAGDTVAESTNDRAVFLMEEVFQQIVSDPTVNGSVQNAELTRYQEENGADENGRVCTFEFEIEFTNQTL
jgi:hypothetical protein|tara:strand:+ start:16 stop:450 length:435 start_codon:yes stop_codon:yes gene_type:complete